jgi:transcriptional regulator with XRE-family HTH domain
MAGDMIAHAASLSAIRKAVSKTQSQMGQELGMPQNAISQLEKRSDLLVSTLARYVDALGAELDLVVRMKDGTEIVLAGLGRAAKKPAKKPSSRRRNASRLDRKAA